MNVRRRQQPRLRLMLFAGIGASVLVIAMVKARRARAEAEAAHADVGFMRAMHAALRRDAARFVSVAPRLKGAERIPPTIEDGWTQFRDELVRHHGAEDDDLWPALRSHLSAPNDFHELDLMVEEHRQLQPAIDAVEDALAERRDVLAAAKPLASVLGDHLDHEERKIFPLLERHLSRREWRSFLVTERRRTPLRHRPEFLTWVLDDASERDTAAVLAELPPPGRVVYRRLLRPRYVAKHRWQSETPALSRAT